MQHRVCVLSLAVVSTVCAGGSALAGPLSLSPQSPINGGRPVAAARGPVQPQVGEDQGYIQQTFGAPASAETQPPRVRHAAAQGNMGGGFLEFLFRGPSGGSRY